MIRRSVLGLVGLIIFGGIAFAQQDPLAPVQGYDQRPPGPGRSNRMSNGSRTSSNINSRGGTSKNTLRRCPRMSRSYHPLCHQGIDTDRHPAMPHAAWNDTNYRSRWRLAFSPSSGAPASAGPQARKCSPIFIWPMPACRSTRKRRPCGCSWRRNLSKPRPRPGRRVLCTPAG